MLLKKPILYIVVNNHFDLTWRRCWQRPLTFRGRSFVSYVDLQTYYLLDNIALAEQNPGYKFEAESVQVMRKFLDRHPEHLATLKRLSQEGRFAVTGGGEAIVDSNMIHGESLVRNYIDGLLWVEKTLGRKTRLAVRNDAFGNSAQLPQVLRGCEIAWATGMSYSNPEGLYWQGLDGSTILHQTLPFADRSGGVWKYPPCPVCAGTGKVGGAECSACAGRGIPTERKAFLPGKIHPDAFASHGAAIVASMPEEMLPNPALLDWAKDMSVNYDVRFALEEDVLPHIQPWLDQVDDPPTEALHPTPELNPNNSGCLVTRIKTKQVVRRQEHALLAAETLSVMSALKGQAYPTEWLKRIRQHQYFTQFHDAITATHVDAAYAELKEFWASIDHETGTVQERALSALCSPVPAENTLSAINPTGQVITSVCTAIVPGATNASLVDEAGRQVPVFSCEPAGQGKIKIIFLGQSLPPFSARKYKVVPANANADPTVPLPEPVIENDRFRVTADGHGLIEIFDKTLVRPVAIHDGLRPGELLLEHDEGSPWATLHPDQQRTPLSPYTCLVAAETNSSVQCLIFDIQAPRELGFAGKCLSARMTVTLRAGIERVDFAVHAIWEAFNHRLRAAFPVPSQPGSRPRHLYEIPYGILERQPYAPTFRWAGANGDWPAIHWAGVEQPGLSVALLNQGIPSYRIEPGPEKSEVILLSLLRSPSVPTYLHEPEYYTMTDYDGMRDAGEHDFAFAVCAYDQPFRQNGVVQDGDTYNTIPIVVQGEAELPPMPLLLSGSARISAVKWAEEFPDQRSSAVILRLVEFRGNGGKVLVQIPPAFGGAALVNLLERQDQPLQITDGTVQVTLRPWEIATLKLALA